MYEPSIDAATRIRRFLRTLLTGWAVHPDTVEDTLLVVEELVANVVDHAHTRFLLIVRLQSPVLQVSVRDCCDRLPQPRPFDPYARRGRGLQLIDGLTARWGYELHTTADDQFGCGKTVWAELTT